MSSLKCRAGYDIVRRMEKQAFNVDRLIEAFGSPSIIYRARDELELSCPTIDDVHNWRRGIRLSGRQLEALTRIANHLGVSVDWDDLWNGSKD